MQDALGIDDKKCHKLKAEVEKVRNQCMQDCALFGWGNNKHGQLATKATMLSVPKKIDLPETITIDETNKDSSIKTKTSVLIQKIFCSIRHSGILLSDGEFWACGNCPEAGKAVLTNIIEGNDVKIEEESKAKELTYRDSKTHAAQLADSEEEDEGKINRKKGNKKQKKEKIAPKNVKGKQLTQPANKSKKGQKWEKKREEQILNLEMENLEATISHRFINLTPLLSEKVIGKHCVVEDVWWTPV